MVATLEKSEEIKKKILFSPASKRQKLKEGKKEISAKIQNHEEEDESEGGERGVGEKGVGDGEDEEADNYYQEIQQKQQEKKKLKEEKAREILRQKTMLPPEMIEEDDDDSVGGKRKITPKMEKNLSLRKKAKKQIKNPRVKNKLKYKKALVRRAGQVQKMRDKSQKYQGEKTGIKPNVIKSTPL